MRLGTKLALAGAFLAAIPFIVFAVFFVLALLTHGMGWAWLAIVVIGIPVGLAGNLQDAGFSYDASHIAWLLICALALGLSVITTKFISSKQTLNSMCLSYVYWFLIFLIIISYIVGLAAAYLL